MSQEETGLSTEVQVVPDEGTQLENLPPEGGGRQAGPPPALLEEIRNLREENRRNSEALHQAHIALLGQQSSTRESRVSPVDVAYKKLEANADPDAWKFIGPVVRPLLEELANSRDREVQFSNQLEFLTRRDRERETHSQLANLIPDLDVVGPKMLSLLQDLPAEVQQMYAANPALLVPLAKSIRTGQPMTGKKAVEAARAAVVMDTGGSADRVIPMTADAIGKLDPNSKEFAALQRNFYGQP